MIKKWKLGNLKSVAEPTELAFAPVTVLSGINSSGKSTVLQSILVIAQTLRSAAQSYPLVLNGEFVRLGYLSDLVHNYSVNKPLVLGFEIVDREEGEPDTGPVRLSLQMRLEHGDMDAQPYGHLEKVDICWAGGNIVLNELTDSAQSIRKQQDKINIPADIRDELKQGRYAYVARDSSLWFRYAHPFGPQFNVSNFLPVRYLETYDYHRFQIKKYIRDISDWVDRKNTQKYEYLHAELNKETGVTKAIKQHLRKILSQDRSGKKSETAYYQYKRRAAPRFKDNASLVYGIEYLVREFPQRYRSLLAKELKTSLDSIRLRSKDMSYSDIGVRSNDMPDPLDRVIDQIRNFFSNRIYYLGPLREPPKYLYHLPPFPDSQYVGTRGEFTASVLERYMGEQVSYPLPPNTPNKNHKIVDRGPLVYALQLWLNHMGLLEKVKTKDRGKMGTELIVRSDGVDSDQDLTSIGVGVSQVLPTLVGCLLAPRGTTFLLEQPELHLHPRVQAILADFFLGLTRIGKQVIVETHSEYLINRLRRRVAEDESDTLANDIQIYFVEREKGESHFRSVDLNAYGAVIEWPKGFFDEGPDEADKIIEAAMQKRLKKRLESKGK